MPKTFPFITLCFLLNLVKLMEINENEMDSTFALVLITVIFEDLHV
jgi:hypothetical protein